MQNVLEIFLIYQLCTSVHQIFVSPTANEIHLKKKKKKKKLIILFLTFYFK